MANKYSNSNGTISEQFSLGKGINKILFRTNNGIAEYKNYGGVWTRFDNGGVAIYAPVVELEDGQSLPELVFEYNSKGHLDIVMETM